MKLEYGFTKHVFKTEHGNINVSALRGSYADGYSMHMITADGWNKVQGIETFDSDKLIILGGVNGNYFQMSTGMHLGVEGDGTVLGYSQEPKQPQWLVVYQKNCALGRTFANDYWYAQNEIDFACSPYCTRIYAGVKSIKYSSACNDKDDYLTEQTACIRFTNGDWAIAIFEKCYPREVEAWTLQFEDVDCLMLMDSGGSTQMFECTSGKRKIVRNTGRKIADAMVIAKRVINGGSGYYEKLYQDLKEKNKNLLAENTDLKIKIANAKKALE